MRRTIWKSHSTRRNLTTILCLSAILFLLQYFWLHIFSTRGYDIWTWSVCDGSSLFESDCAVSRAAVARSTQIVVKTGGSEDRSRLRHQLDTVLSKIPHRNVVVYSDLEDQVGDYHVIDVFADISKRERSAYPEFQLYETMQEYKKAGKDSQELQGGWDLAKYMNLAMKRKLWGMRQSIDYQHMVSMKWFVFVDTDTFVEWDNLLMLLEHFDPAENFYLGSPVWTPGLQFAHGGSAYVLSYGALEALNKPSSRDREVLFPSQYGLNVSGMCCGDEALAKVLHSKGINLKGYWPMFNGERPTTVPFGGEHWCEPVISLHHMDGENMQAFWEWMEIWRGETRNRRPFLFEDLFQYLAPQLSSRRENWNNMAEKSKIKPKNRASHRSFQSCEAECERDELCFQFLYDGHQCALGHHIGLGEKASPGRDGERYVSGWNVERIRRWKANNACDSAHWVHSNP